MSVNVQRLHLSQPKTRTLAIYAALILLSVPFVFPFWWMVTSSFKSYSEIFAYPPTLLPHTWHFENYQHVFDLQPFVRQYWNSFYIATMVTLGTLCFSSLAGYAFARINFPGSSLLFLMLLSAIMMPSEVTIIPLFHYIQELGLTNSHIPLIILPMFAGPGITAVFMTRQYFLGLPTELEDAAFLDGLTRWGIYWRIALPLARPILVAVGILTFLASWNLFLEPLVLLSDQAKFTLPLALRGYTDPYGQPLWGEQLAATTLSVIPILAIYVFAQRQVVESFAFSGTKG
ncbi:MAG TPA: carbohydrate ABC transporter permease [Aggregatilinea sp.]|jgi:multiple sugar transport system permease protein|uniref:carbohydrate ABC transporter permease n=2 Tax=Aggregatilinea sp. TaxID=2806333 RepID=UPI002BC38E91|nr:carbohydrate ABC transporter permease [Aggregatilinea sp.]HML21599.1 carbohydrate ABC transporter permease [Aggregatilinea sp.]